MTDHDETIATYLANFEVDLRLDDVDKATTVAIIRSLLDAHASKGTLESILKEIGSPQQLASIIHIHRDAVVLLDGTTIWAVSFNDRPYERDTEPDYGIYLDEQWDPPWPHETIDWQNFGLPRDPERMKESLDRALARARSGQRVEIGCLGAHGRTGTAVGYLALQTGLDEDPVDWVRRVYCRNAVETEVQMVFLRSLRE
jgi:hypothetical protein